MSKSILEQAKELLKTIENDPKALQAFQELIKARSEESKHVEMEMSPQDDKKKRIDELSKRIKACMEKMQKESMDKDDKPHLPGTPEDKAHDVAEEGESVKEAIHDLKDKSTDSKEEMLTHLRSLEDKSQLRSSESRKAGKKPNEKKELEKEQVGPSLATKIVPPSAPASSDNGNNKKFKKPVKFIYKIPKIAKSENYYRNLVKNTFEKADIYSFKEKKKIASLPSVETPKEGQPIVRGKEKGIATRKELKEKFSPDIMPEEKDVPGGTDTKKK